MRLRRKVLLLAVLTMAGCSMAACGKDEKDSKETKSEEMIQEAEDDGADVSEDIDSEDYEESKNNQASKENEDSKEDKKDSKDGEIIDNSDKITFYYDEVEGGIEINDYDYGEESHVIEFPAEIDGKKVVKISYKTCYADQNIKKVILPDTVQEIGDECFLYCTNLESVEFGNSLTHIGMEAFSLCSSLKEISLPDSVIEIETGAFQGTGLKKIEINSNITVLGRFWFNGIEIDEWEVPDTITSIEYMCFRDCENLKYITIPDSVTEIDPDAFYNCENLTIRCKDGSYAEMYAIAQEIPYEHIE